MWENLDKTRPDNVHYSVWPDWKDAGRRVEVELEDGRTVQGELFVGDFFPDGEGDEVPVFSVRDDAGQEYSFAANNRWRFLHTGRDFLFYR